MSRVRAPSPACWESGIGDRESKPDSEVTRRGNSSRRSIPHSPVPDSRTFARVAQLVEHTLGKGEVTGSIPVASSEGSGSGSEKLRDGCVATGPKYGSDCEPSGSAGA